MNENLRHPPPSGRKSLAQGKEPRLPSTSVTTAAQLAWAALPTYPQSGPSRGGLGDTYPVPPKLAARCHPQRTATTAPS